MIEKVVHNENLKHAHAHSDMLYLLTEDPHASIASTLYHIFNFLCSSLIIALNLAKILAFEQLWLQPWPLIELGPLIIPYDTVFFHLFLIMHLSQSEYIGLTSLDYWQYFAMRTFPILTLLISLFLIGAAETYHTYLWYFISMTGIV